MDLAKDPGGNVVDLAKDPGGKVVDLAKDPGARANPSVDFVATSVTLKHNA